MLTSNSIPKTCSGFWVVKRVPLLLRVCSCMTGYILAGKVASTRNPPHPARLALASVDWSWPGTSGPHHSSHQFHLSNHLCLSAFTFLLNFQNSLLCKKHDRLGSGARKQYTRSLGSLLATHVLFQRPTWSRTVVRVSVNLYLRFLQLCFS